MKLKLLSMLLLLATVLGLFGCAGGGGDTTPTTDGGGETTSEDDLIEDLPSDLLFFAKDDATEYQIVYPMNNYTRETQAKSIAAAILDATGVEIPVVHDSKPEKEKEILVGDVARYIKVDGKTSTVVGKYSLTGVDFVIEIIGEKLFICGATDQAVASAMDYFMNKVLYLSIAWSAAGIKSGHKTLFKAADATGATLTGSDENYLYFSMGAGSIMETFCRLSFTGSNTGWRIQTKHNASDDFDDMGASQFLSVTLNETPYTNLEKITVKTEGNKTVVTGSDGSRVEIDFKNFKMDFYTPGDDGELSATVTNISSNAAGSMISGALEDGEAIYGTGERFNSVNQRGKFIELYSTDKWSSPVGCYVAIPILASSRGSGILINRFEYMTLDLGFNKKDEWVVSVTESEMDCYVMTTEKTADVIKGYSDLSGYAELPEEWTYGMIICRYGPDLKGKWSFDVNDGYPTVDGRGLGVYDFIAKMEQYDLPWTGILAEGWDYGKQIPRSPLKELCDYVHSLGKKFILYMGFAGVSVFQEGYITDYAIKQQKTDGTTTTVLPEVVLGGFSGNPDNPNGGGRTYLDVTHPLAVEWYFEEYWDNLANEIGADGCKIDFCEFVPETLPLLYYDKSTPTNGSHHWLSAAFNSMFWDMISSKPDGGMCYIRGGGLGLQRAPYVWGGDQMRNYESLRFHVVGSLSMGISGLPFFSYDMSGYKYSNTPGAVDGWYNMPLYDIDTEANTFIRGLQYTAFTICMQQHGHVRNAFDFAEYTQYFVEGKEVILMYGNKGAPYIEFPSAKVGAAGEKYNVTLEGDEMYITKDDKKLKVEVKKNDDYVYVTDIYRAYVKLHELLTPYITEYATVATETGMPVMRHLILHWQDDANVYNIDNQYMFGDAFMVAPVLNDQYSRDIYLPEGNWLDMNTGDTYRVGPEGKTLTDYEVSIGTLPLFYNQDTTSETAEGLLDGIREIFDYVKTIEP
ncbi:MAG: glycoside hydrolase family 31 protein [Clostridia bacterium]|nr:glycoside hydrolase family 31 protein [Clostridia bacterium]